MVKQTLVSRGSLLYPSVLTYSPGTFLWDFIFAVEVLFSFVSTFYKFCQNFCQKVGRIL